MDPEWLTLIWKNTYGRSTLGLQCFNKNVVEIEKKKLKNLSEKLDNTTNLEHFIF